MNRLVSLRHTCSLMRMTMLSFRVSESEADQARRWAEHLGIDRSQLLRDALASHLVRLRAETDIDAWLRHPLTAEESVLSEASDWGPAEDWADWTDATR